MGFTHSLRMLLQGGRAGNIEYLRSNACSCHCTEEGKAYCAAQRPIAAAQGWPSLCAESGHGLRAESIR